MLAAAAVAGPAHQGRRARAQLRQGHRARRRASRTRRGQAVIPIDCDLQHPPELIPQFVAKWREGFDMVHRRAQQARRGGLAPPQRCRAPTTGCMRLDDERRDPAERGRLPADRSQDPRHHQPDAGAPPLHEGHLRVARLQGRVDRVPGQRPRERDAQSTWSFFKLWRFALDGLFSFSTAPLKLWTYIGLASARSARSSTCLITLIQKLFFGHRRARATRRCSIVLLFFNGLLDDLQRDPGRVHRAHLRGGEGPAALRRRPDVRVRRRAAAEVAGGRRRAPRAAAPAARTAGRRRVPHAEPRLPQTAQGASPSLRPRRRA